jgi:hypothetical protein
MAAICGPSQTEICRDGMKNILARRFLLKRRPWMVRELNLKTAGVVAYDHAGAPGFV